MARDRGWGFVARRLNAPSRGQDQNLVSLAKIQHGPLVR